jgi:hypothetical protein
VPRRRSGRRRRPQPAHAAHPAPAAAQRARARARTTTTTTTAPRRQAQRTTATTCQPMCWRHCRGRSRRRPRRRRRLRAPPPGASTSSSVPTRSTATTTTASRGAPRSKTTRESSSVGSFRVRSRRVRVRACVRGFGDVVPFLCLASSHVLTWLRARRGPFAAVLLDDARAPPAVSAGALSFLDELRRGTGIRDRSSKRVRGESTPHKHTAQRPRPGIAQSSRPTAYNLPAASGRVCARPRELA